MPTILNTSFLGMLISAVIRVQTDIPIVICKYLLNRASWLIKFLFVVKLKKYLVVLLLFYQMSC